LALHACPVHDGPHSASHQTHHSQHPQQHHSCTCLGACCPTVGVHLASTPEIAPARVIAFVEPDVSTGGPVRSADVQVTLPPALGPPVVSG
jgi:hypothetical protein